MPVVPIFPEKSFMSLNLTENWIVFNNFRKFSRDFGYAYGDESVRSVRSVRSDGSVGSVGSDENRNDMLRDFHASRMGSMT